MTSKTPKLSATKQLMMVLGVVLTALLFTGVNTESTPHLPYPGADRILIGDGVSWVSQSLSTFSQTKCLAYANGSHVLTTIGCPVTVNTLFTCPAGVTCTSSTNTFMPGVNMQASWVTAIQCSAATNGTGAGNVVMHIADVTAGADLATANIPCTSFVQSGSAPTLFSGGAAPGGFGLAVSGNKDALYWVTSGCTVAPTVPVCTVFAAGI